MLADRARRIGVSPLQEFFTEAQRLKHQGVDVVDLSVGEPDFPTPAHVKAAAVAAIETNFTKYTTNAGILELRTAICESYRSRYGVRYEASETIVTAGGKQGLFNTAMALFGPGDEVITHTPGWPTISEQIALADARPVIVRGQPEDGFRVTPDAIGDAMTPRTRGIVLNSPCNPTGRLIAERDLAAIVDLAAPRGIWIVLDLCYEQLIYADVPHNLPRTLVDRMRDRTVLVGSVSKTYAMTGWRCGWALGPEAVIAACNAVQSHATSNVSSITQKAAVAALTGPQDDVAAMREAYRSRCTQAAAWLATDPRMRLTPPDGAFYLFPDVSAYLSLDGFRTSTDLARVLLAEAHVAVTPGEAFDAPGYLRVSCATSIDRLREGVDRLLAFVARHAPVGA